VVIGLGHGYKVLYVAFDSKDILASGSADRTIKLGAFNFSK